MNSDKKNRRLLIILSLVAVLMFGFGFAMVPLYNVFCDVTGLNGKIDNSPNKVTADYIDKSRLITVQFVATGNANLPWAFYPLTKQIRVHPGEITRINYYAKNNSDHDMVVQAIPSVTPGLAAKSLRKTECFCFTQQILKSGEAKDMPVLFHIDRDLPKNINTITLSYTLFDLTNKLDINNGKSN